MKTERQWIRKIVGLPIIAIFFNLGFIIFAQEAVLSYLQLITIILFNIFIYIDVVIRPTSVKRDEYNRSIVAIAFLLMPLILVFPYIEYKYFTSQLLSPFILYLMAVLGIGLIIAGGMIDLLSRIQLGHLGGPRIVIENDHQLIITGMYRYIRHPMYSGFLLLFFGYCFSFGSLITSIMVMTGLFLIFRNRIEVEERLLISHFGDEYLNYMNRTKRLFPFVY